MLPISCYPHTCKIPSSSSSSSTNFIAMQVLKKTSGPYPLKPSTSHATEVTFYPPVSKASSYFAVSVPPVWNSINTLGSFKAKLKCTTCYNNNNNNEKICIARTLKNLSCAHGSSTNKQCFSLCPNVRSD